MIVDASMGAHDFSPPFTTEGWFNRIGAMLGSQDIDFSDAPELSKQYVLKSDDEAAVLDFLRQRVLALLAGLQNLCPEV